MTEESEGRLFDLEKRLADLCAEVETTLQEVRKWRRVYANQMDGMNETLNQLLVRVRELERR